MDGAQLGSIAVSEHKARTAAKFRRPTKAFEEAIQKGDTRVLTIDDVMGSRGGIPLVEDGKLIGAIGCSGGAGRRMRWPAWPGRRRSTNRLLAAAMRAIGAALPGKCNC